MGAEKYRLHDHEKLAHYADAALDIEFRFPLGFKELEGIHSRTNFDLKNHEQFSGKKLQYFDPEINESYVPYVIETSIGLDRMFLAVLSNSLTEENLKGHWWGKKEIGYMCKNFWKDKIAEGGQDLDDF